MQSGADVVDAYTRLTPPFAVKLQSPDMLHKSDHGGVALGVMTQANLVEAVEHMLSLGKESDLRMDGILIQEMTPIAQELIAGFQRDAVFGALLLIGRGGIEVELRPDSVMAYLPLGATEIREMLSELQASALFQGYRGGPVGDLDHLSEVLSEIGDYFLREPDINEIEVNPLALSKSGTFIALDALTIMRVDHERGR